MSDIPDPAGEIASPREEENHLEDSQRKTQDADQLLTGFQAILPMLINPRTTYGIMVLAT